MGVEPTRATIKVTLNGYQECGAHRDSTTTESRPQDNRNAARV
jgi:hypothetical protein